MFAGIRTQLKDAEILPKFRHHKQGAAVISELLKKGSISQEEYIDLAGNEIGRKLLESNVFAFHFWTGRVTFQSTAVKRYCGEKWETTNELGQHGGHSFSATPEHSKPKG
jgi:hypothetical protein